MSFYKKTFSYKTASTEDKKRENIYELKFHERNYAEYIIIFKLLVSVFTVKMLASKFLVVIEILAEEWCVVFNFWRHSVHRA